MAGLQAPPLLTPEQRAIVETQHGPVLVEADVGCGKTLVLVERALYALETGRPASSMLALTFTNRAAQEMRDRLAARGAPDAAEVTVATFHALCAHILRQDGKELAIDPTFTVWDEVDAREALRNAVARRSMPDDNFELRELARQIGELKRKHIYPQNYPWPPDPFLALYRAYQRELDASNALDYDDLVAQTWTLFRRFEPIRAVWARRLSWVEVDEFQDTESAEFDVIHLLAHEHRNICVFADEKQSIYGWRGVDGTATIGRFATDYPECSRLRLGQGFRSAAPIKALANAVLDPTAPAATDFSATGAPVALRAYDTEEDECDAAARRVQEWHNEGLAWHETAVLTRTNRALDVLAERFTALNTPHVTVAAAEFFRRPEVKDLVAYLRLVVAPHDIGAVRRVAQLPRFGLEPSFLAHVEASGRACGARLSDFVDLEALRSGDPCAPDLTVAAGAYVVLDCETTGRDRRVDEVVALGALRVDGLTGARQRFDAVLRPSRQVGPSAAIHGYDDAFLAEHGREPRAVYADLLEFIGDLPLVGHNILGFDIPLINANLWRLGLPELATTTVDTLLLSRRLEALERHNLARVAARCGVPLPQPHDAADDARCCADCFQVLTGRLELAAGHRRDLIAAHRDRFLTLARLASSWRTRAATTGLSELIDVILSESGYVAYQEQQAATGARRLKTLRELREGIVRKFDVRPPREAAWALLDYISLARSADTVGPEDDRVSLLTMHSAKGLEFKAVLVVGAYDGGVPASWTLFEREALDEERRLLYVALTRAKERLELTFPRTRTTRTGRAQTCDMSRFLKSLPPELLAVTAGAD